MEQFSFFIAKYYDSMGWVFYRWRGCSSIYFWYNLNIFFFPCSLFRISSKHIYKIQGNRIMRIYIFSMWYNSLFYLTKSIGIWLNKIKLECILLNNNCILCLHYCNNFDEYDGFWNRVPKFSNSILWKVKYRYNENYVFTSVMCY